MIPDGHLLIAVDNARSAVYDLVLLAHVLSVIAGFGTVVVAGAYALALRRPGPVSPSVERYYRPGVNWAGRTLFLIPVFGVALIAMSHGQWSFSDGWVTLGLTLWAAAALVAEMALWPAERQLQLAVADRSTAGDRSSLRRRCLGVAGMAGGLLVVAIVASAVMVAKP
jgi:hypothetical protein